jgi:ankyrin repeat protein
MNFKLISLALIALAVCQSGLVMEKEPQDIFEEVKTGNVDAVKKFLLEKSSVLSGLRKGEALYWAAYHGNKEIVQLLLEYKAIINWKDRSGHTPLYWASYRGYLEIVQELLNHGADINCEDNNAPLINASCEGYSAIVEELLRRDAQNVNWGSGPYKLTALHYASQREECREIVQKLLHYGADINCKDDEGDTPLHHAASLGKLENLKELLRYAVDINRVRNRLGETVLDIAKEKENFLMVKLLEDELKKQEEFKNRYTLGPSNPVIQAYPLKFAQEDENLPQAQGLLQSASSAANNDLSALLNNSFVLKRDK